MIIKVKRDFSLDFCSQSMARFWNFSWMESETRFIKSFSRTCREKAMSFFSETSLLKSRSYETLSAFAKLSTTSRDAVFRASSIWVIKGTEIPFQGKTYSGVYSDPDVGTVTILLTFSASGNSGTLAQSAGDYSDVISFTYTVSGNTLTLTSPTQDEPMTITYSSTRDTFTVAEVGLTLTRT